VAELLTRFVSPETGATLTLSGILWTTSVTLRPLKTTFLVGTATNLSDRQTFSDRLRLLFDEERDLDVVLQVVAAVLDSNNEAVIRPELDNRRHALM